jgi:hypothetical protein
MKNAQPEADLLTKEGEKILNTCLVAVYIVNVSLKIRRS